jgi:Flp pilus assembly protein CpaB
MANPAAGFVNRMRKLLAATDAVDQGDEDLVRRFCSGSDAEAFEVIVRRHGPMVLGVCRRLLGNDADADDAFQATFAVLARKAASLSHPEQLAGWLFQVAYRTARRARTIDRRRQARLAPLREASVESPIAEVIWREFRPIFDEEIARLPEKLRLPVVHCFLEGRSKRVAARLLGWPEGTISSRLQQARELLRDRLARRGVALSTSTATVALLQATASATVPPALVASTVCSAPLAAAGASVFNPVTALALGVIHSMFVSKLKIVAALMLMAGVVGGGAGWFVMRNNQLAHERAEAIAAREQPLSELHKAKAERAFKAPAQQRSQEPVLVLVANTDFYPNIALSSADVRVRELTAEERSGGFYEENKGKFLPPNIAAANMRIPSQKIKADAVLMREHFRDELADAAVIRMKNGMRAVNVMVPKERAAGGVIQLGEYVNVLLTCRIPKPDGNTMVETAEIGRDCRVILKRPSLYPTTGSDPAGRAIPWGLEANPYRAALIDFAQCKGEITLEPIAKVNSDALTAKRELGFGDVTSEEYRDEDIRVNKVIRGDYAIGYDDLARIFKIPVGDTYKSRLEVNLRFALARLDAVKKGMDQVPDSKMIADYALEQLRQAEAEASRARAALEPFRGDEDKKGSSTPAEKKPISRPD